MNEQAIRFRLGIFVLGSLLLLAVLIILFGGFPGYFKAADLYTVTFDVAEPGSPLIPPNGSYLHRFDKAGVYPYHCTPHPFMRGVIVVK